MKTKSKLNSEFMFCLKFVLQKTFRTKQIFLFQEKKHAVLDNCSVWDRGTFCLLITLVYEAMSRLHNHGENHSSCPLIFSDQGPG